MWELVQISEFKLSNLLNDFVICILIKFDKKKIEIDVTHKVGEKVLRNLFHQMMMHFKKDESPAHIVDYFQKG